MNLEEMQIELVGHCNASCVYCTWQTRTTPQVKIETALAERLQEEAAALGVRRFGYHGVGEPLLHPDLLAILDNGDRLNLPHGLATNGSRLNGELAKSLAGRGNLDLVISLHADLPARFLELCVANAVDYLGRRPAHRSLTLLMIMHERCRGFYRRFVETFLPLVERTPRARLYLKQPQTFPRDDVPQRGFVELELANHPQVYIDRSPTPYSIGRGCTMPERFLLVLADGTYAPCCVGTEDWGLGNARDVPLAQAWRSPRMAEIRRLWAAADDSVLCGRCKRRDFAAPATAG